MSSFVDLLKQLNDPKPASLEKEAHPHNDNHEQFPLSDNYESQIIMHRNAHFGGQFSLMIDYYRSENVGAVLDCDLKSIQKLAKLEEKLHEDIAPLRLTLEEMEKVDKVLELYQGLKKLHSQSQNENSIPTLLTNLILTEEEIPEHEIEALSASEKALPYLLDILKTEEFYDPLYPGYGRTPMHVANCLGKIKSEKAIIPLFESMHFDNFNYEESAISALVQIGKKAFDFLLQVLQNQPFTLDNEKAAVCLINFKESQALAQTCLKLLQNFECLNYPNLVVHLILGCAGLKDKKDIELFSNLKNQLPAMYSSDFQYIYSKLKKL